MTEAKRPGSLSDSRPLSALFFTLSAFSLAVPNVIYSGVYFFETLHLIKWVAALVPVALMTILAGVLALVKGPQKASFKVDSFGWIWFVLLLYITSQPLWVPMKSMVTFYREWFFFAGLWAFYILCLNRFKESWLRPVLWLSSLTASIDVLFAELQMMNRVDFFKPFNLILPTPGNYIGNTGQQNMFGLWMAITALGSVFIYLRHGVKGEKGLGKFFAVTNLVLFPVVMWGLWQSTSRSSVLSFFVGLCASAFMIISGRDKTRLRRLGLFLSIVLSVLGATLLLDHSRSASMIYKTRDMIENAETIGGRRGIWRTSWTMASQNWEKGVGLGQFKLRYLDYQKEAFKRYPDMEWQYTNWAHNEYLQWLCEAGIGGFALLCVLGILWLWSFFRYMALHRGSPFPDGVLWGCSFLFMIWFDALWTRPFHRIENSLWLSLAFALANLHIMPSWAKEGLGFLKKPLTYRALGALMAALSLGGLFYLYQGVKGDVTIRKAMESKSAPLQKTLLQRAAQVPMVRDMAQRQLAYHLINYGDSARDPKVLAEGLNMLYEIFEAGPTADDMTELMKWAGRLNKDEIIMSIASYLKPGTFTIKKIETFQ